MFIDQNNSYAQKRRRSGPAAAGNRSGVDEIILRPFRNTGEDYEAIVEIENSNFAESPISVSEYRFYDETRDPKYLQGRLIAEVNGRAAGFVTYGQPWWSFAEGKYFITMHVLPEWHESAVAAALFDGALSDLQRYQPEHLTSETREDHRYVVRLLQEHGFKQVMRVPVSDLAVQAFDAAPFAGLIENVLASGIRIDNLRTVAAEESAWKQKLWDLEWEILQDVPAPQPLTRLPFEQWQKRYFESPAFSAEAQIIAREDGRFVGVSGLWTSEEDPKKLYTGYTGVVRSHRRRGIATAMKVQGIRYAQKNGIECIETDNEENNPMLTLNKRLGFREKPAYVSYEKTLKDTNPSKELETALL